MDWRVVTTTFWLLFLAELGDKTQLAVISLAGSRRDPLSVFAGAAAALCLVTLAGVLLGDGLLRWLPRPWIQRGAGLLFVIVGLFMLLQRPAA